MGMTHYGELVYGFHFGAEESLLLREAQPSDANEYGYFKTSWYDGETADETEDDEDEGGTIITLMTRRLYESIPDAPPAEWDFQRKEIVKERLGVWFEGHCSVDYPMWVLATAEMHVPHGEVEPVDLADLMQAPSRNGWDAKLAHALRVLDVNPVQEAAAWLLCTDRG